MGARACFDSTINKIFGLYYRSRSQKVPKPNNQLVLESATSLARKIQRGELTSEEVVRAFIVRIREVNPLINSVVDERFDEAIMEARSVDKRIADGTTTDEEFERKPFLGVPFTAKETVACKGLSNTFGLPSRRTTTASFDAEVIQLMKNSGAVLLAVTNVPQLSAWIETTNPIYGTTCNPYDTARTCGGSSGGEASIVAACGSPIGIGTELGGSLRNPAFMCGLFAHKPTTGIASVHGVLFNVIDKKDAMATTGFLTKYAEDLVPLLKIIIGDNLSRLKLDQEVNITRLRVFYVLDPGDVLVSPIGNDINGVMLEVVRYFATVLRQEPRVLELDGFRHGGRIWRHWVTREPNLNFIKDVTNRKGRVSVGTELLRFCLRRSSFNIAIILGLLANMIPKENSRWAEDTTRILHDTLTEILGTDGVLLYPSSPRPAGYHNSPLFSPFDANLFTVWNALKFCVTQVPLGLSPEGLPVGIQVVAAPYQDHLTLAVAGELERAFGGYVPPFADK